MAEITQNISSLGSVPTTADPATFDARADTFLGTALPTLRTEINTWAGQANALGADVTTKSATATTQATNAATSATSASASATLINFKGQWSMLTGALNMPATVLHEGVYYALNANLINVAASEPGATADWSPINQFVVETRTSNTEFQPLDSGKLFRYTTGGFTQTVVAAASAGAGYFVQLVNDSAGTVTFDPAGAETVNGASTLAILAGQRAVIWCSGTSWLAAVFAGPVGDHEVIVTTGNGHGSTNTKIRRFTTTQRSSGTAITYADSATLGATFTINETGMYSISYTDLYSIDVTRLGISKNSAELTSNIQDITASSRLAIGLTFAANSFETCSVTVRLSQGDVIRPHTNGAPDSSSVVTSVFRIVKVNV